MRTTPHDATCDPVPFSPDEVAPVAPRVLVLAVDQLLVVVCCVVVAWVWWATGHGAVSRLLVAWLVVGGVVELGQVLAEAVSGATLGGALLRVRTVSARTGWPAGLVVVLVRRAVLGAAGVVVPVLGAYLVAMSGVWGRAPARRGWHDWVAGTVVLHASAVPGQDERAAERARRQAARLVGRGDDAGSQGPQVSRRADVVPAAPASSELDLVLAWPSVDLDQGVTTGPEPGETGLPAATCTGPRPGRQTDGPARRQAQDADEQGEERTTTTVLPTLWPEPTGQPSRPRARHRAVTLGLGRPRTQAAEGRHRALGEPTEPQVRLPAGLPDVWATDVELTRLSVREARPCTLRLVFDTGQRVEVTGPGAVGRERARVAAQTLVPAPVHQVVVDDPKRLVSRLHLRFGPEPGRDALWVVDEGSTNGTVLVRPDGEARALPPGVRAVIDAGWQIRFGERSAVVESIGPRPHSHLPQLLGAVRG